YFFTDRATTQFYTLSLHDALPICHGPVWKVPRESVRLPVLAVSLVVGAALPPGHGPPVPGAAQVVLGRVDGQRLVVDQVRAVPRVEHEVLGTEVSMGQSDRDVTRGVGAGQLERALPFAVAQGGAARE